jgi:hypothetical protein
MCSYILKDKFLFLREKLSTIDEKGCDHMPDKKINIETDHDPETIYEETTVQEGTHIRDSKLLHDKNIDEVDDGIRDGIEY